MCSWIPFSRIYNEDEKISQPRRMSELTVALDKKGLRKKSDLSRRGSKLNKLN